MTSLPGSPTIGRHLEALYPGADHAAIGERLHELFASLRRRPLGAWSAADTVLITYGATVVAPGEAPLRTLRRFLDDYVGDGFSAVHILPFFPYSSDDGFSVIDYRIVDPALGDWTDIGAIADDYQLMVDLILNHASAQSAWFQQFRAGRAPGTDYFVTADPDADTSTVTRPRTHPLLQPVATPSGERHVWCTFGHDQVDLDFANPDVLLEFASILVDYLDRGATLIRLDAVAYLWKQLGTTSIHLEQTHTVVKLFAQLLAGRARLITETNVPHAENISYFGAGDEADAVYNFTLPPLVLDAFWHERSGPLQAWLTALDSPPPGRVFLNFLASHDGFGVRPAEGLLTTEEITALADRARALGGFVSEYDSPNGPRPYELNLSLADALGSVDRLVAAHALMAALPGVPAVYIHSLLATPADAAAVERTGNRRAINRVTLDDGELRAELADEASRPAQALRRITDLLAVRARQPAFDPAADLEPLDVGPTVVAFRRSHPDQRITVLANVGAERVDGFAPEIVDGGVDLISGQPIATLAPGQVGWVAD